MIYKGINYKTYTEIIDHALSLKGNAQRNFVNAYRKSGKFAASNIGYFAGYYGPKKRARIHKVFRTKHPMFGRFS